MSRAEIYTRRSRAQDSDYDNDHSGRLVYWDTREKKGCLLEPGQVITDQRVVIGKIGQQNVLPNHLSLKRRDLYPTELTDESGNFIGVTVPPGISGFLFFSSHDSHGVIKNFSQNSLDKALHAKNRVHITQVEDINNAGWVVYFTPLVNRNLSVMNPLHVIISPNSFQNPLHQADATQSEKEALAKAFVRW